MVNPSNYKSQIPWPIYLGLQNKWPQSLDETEKDWMRRIEKNLSLPVYRTVLTEMMQHVPAIGPFVATELKRTVENKDWRTGAMQRDKLMDGLDRVAERKYETWGREMGPLKKGERTNIINIYDPEKDGPMLLESGRPISIRKSPLAIIGPTENLTVKQRCEAIIAELAAATNVDTPENGSVFWNGIDQRALALQIKKWNAEEPGVLFGQLEATTDVRHVDGIFKWEKTKFGENLKKYFTKVSANLGDRARGHVTAVVLWGFRHDSILTTAELPGILYNMAKAIDKGEKPAVTDVSIVVIDCIGTVGVVKIVNNFRILDLPVWRPKKETKGYAKTDVELTGNTLANFKIGKDDWAGKPPIPESIEFWTYLQGRPNVPSPAATRIEANAKKLVRPDNMF